MDKNIQFDNTNSTNQIDLLYLTNMTTCKNNNGVKVDIVNKKEVDFYKKRIFQLCKDVLRNKHANPMVKDSFDHFCCNAIEYFKMTDKGLECLDCDPSIFSQSYQKENGFIKVDIDTEGAKINLKDGENDAEIKLDKNGITIQ